MLRVYLWIGSILLVVTALAGSHYWAYSKGWTAADQSARIEELETRLAQQRQVAEMWKAQAAEIQRQAEVAQEVARKSAERERVAQDDLQELETKFGEYVRSLQDLPLEGGGCLLSADDARRLLDLAGGAPTAAPGAPGPAGSAGNVRRPGAGPPTQDGR